MNSGCFEKEFKDVLISVQLIDQQHRKHFPKENNVLALKI